MRLTLKTSPWLSCKRNSGASESRKLKRKGDTEQRK
ncbi:hypothetical protein ID866_8121 [Astraeus odoratus]|nr:hypothetical protein ID866_8121 [Astraeus odoratus]